MFIKEGPLKIQVGKERKSFYFFLFNDALLQTLPLPKSQFRFIEFYPLQYSSVLPHTDGKKQQNF